MVFRRASRAVGGLSFLLLSLLLFCGASAAQQTDYVIGPQDVLTIAVWDQEDLNGKFAVETDGTFTFPLI